MSDEYDLVKKSSLKFKGEKRKKRRKKEGSNAGSSVNKTNPDHDERLEDAESHGGWWKVTRYEHIREDVAIEFLPGCYAKALSNGTIVLGQPHPPGEGPDEEEIFTAVCASTNQIAFKSGFGRYLGVDNRKRVMGLAEAIGDTETFLPVFENNKLALCAFNDLFLAPEDTDNIQPIVAASKTVGPHEVLSIRINHDPLMAEQRKESHSGTSKLSGQIYEEELGYLKKHQDLCNRKALKKARLEGELHETLLDSRVKKKSDKYCK